MCPEKPYAHSSVGSRTREMKCVQHTAKGAVIDHTISHHRRAVNGASISIGPFSGPGSGIERDEVAATAEIDQTATIESVDAGIGEIHFFAPVVASSAYMLPLELK